ncbi:MAG: SDR family oxidoreductase [Pseudomonadota bacterium]
MSLTDHAEESILITGASGGIGQALVTTFGNAGYHVIATGLSAPPAGLPYADFIPADLQRTVMDEAYAANVFTAIRASLAGKPLKALINNAAVQILDDAAYLSRAAWQETLNVNLLAPFFWTQALLEDLAAAQGCVLNISSIHARLTKARFAAYATSKAALSGLTRSLAIEFGGRVRVNAIEPAAIDTPMLRAGFSGNDDGFAQLEQYHPSKCIGTPEKIGELAKLLVEQNSMFLNGAVLPYDGGISACLHDPN